MLRFFKSSKNKIRSSKSPKLTLMKYKTQFRLEGSKMPFRAKDKNIRYFPFEKTKISDNIVFAKK